MRSGSRSPRPHPARWAGDRMLQRTTLCVPAQHGLHRPGVPHLSAMGSGYVITIETLSDLPKRVTGLPLLVDPIDDRVVERLRSAQANTGSPLDGEGLSSALADNPALPLGSRRHHVGHE